MKKGSTLILKLVIFLIGLGVLALCVFALPSAWRGAFVEYPEYPTVVLAFRMIFVGMYISAIPFYLGLYQGFKLLNLIDKNIAFSDLSVKALKKIKYYSLAVGIIYMSIVPLLYPFADMDDAPGTLLFGFAIACAPMVVSVFAAVLEKLLANALEIKSENDLTV